MPGPPPKRTDEKLGNYNGPKPRVDQIQFADDARELPGNPDWCDAAKYAYRAFLESPLSRYHTETDVVFGWMTSQAIHEAVTRPSPTKTIACESMMRAALFNEAERRRVRIELTKQEAPVNPAVESNVAAFRRRRTG